MCSVTGVTTDVRCQTSNMLSFEGYVIKGMDVIGNDRLDTCNGASNVFTGEDPNSP